MNSCAWVKISGGGMVFREWRGQFGAVVVLGREMKELLWLKVCRGQHGALGLGKTVLVLPVWARRPSYTPLEGLLISISTYLTACFSYDPYFRCYKLLNGVDCFQRGTAFPAPSPSPQVSNVTCRWMEWAAILIRSLDWDLRNMKNSCSSFINMAGTVPLHLFFFQ